MKPKLSPELSYVIGLWGMRRTKEGIGVRGEDVIPVFVNEVIGLKLTEAGKLLYSEKSVYFYHSKWRKFFQEVWRDRMERFKYLNEYSANFLAGVFDACGQIDEKGVVHIEGFGEDEMVLSRLGFKPKKKGKKIVIGNPRAFLKFIYDFLKVKKTEMEKYLSVK
jgi:hypothetical protein